MSGTLLTCTLCGSPNAFPTTHVNMRELEGLTTLCSSCNGATLQRLSGVPSRGSQHGDSASILLTLTQNGTSACQPMPVLESGERLWRRLQDALVNNGVSMAEFFRCDTPTKSRIISALGFSTAESPQLLELSRTNNPRVMLNIAAQRASDPAVAVTSAHASATAASVRSVSPEPFLSASKCKSEAAAAAVPVDPANSAHNVEGVVETPQRAVQTERLLPGLTIQANGSLVARCSVYPHLPADFWCSLCGVLVSSRCHVSGIHKDHPFITLRQAAEAHVRDLQAWAERCRCQLNVASSIVANLQHGKEIIRGGIRHQEEKLDQHFDDILRGLTVWRDELKSSMRMQMDAQLKNIDVAVEKTNALIEYYAERQRSCGPLLQFIPPVHQVDGQSEDWSLRVMDLVSHLKVTRHEPIPMPRLSLPEVKSFATTATYMDLLKAVSVPAAVRVPDVFDTGYLNFPHPSDLGREAFMLRVPDDAKARGLLVYSGRTLTRSPEVIPSHVLVCATQIFYTGITSWEVHVDRLGVGPGRILAGVLMAGTDGEGVVWDGHRIVGPNEGECRVLPDRCRLQTGTTLRFVLELEAPSYFLICYYEDDVVARVPLPPALKGWIPAFSVFGPQDQLTVVPTSTTAAERLLTNPVPETTEEGKLSNGEKAKKREEETGNEQRETKLRLVEQEQKLNALQQQLLAVHSRMDQEQYEKLLNQPKEPRGASSRNNNDINNAWNVSSPTFQQKLMFSPSNGEDFATQQTLDHSPHDAKEDQQRQSLSSGVAGKRDGHSARSEGYSEELQNLLNYVGSIR